MGNGGSGYWGVPGKGARLEPSHCPAVGTHTFTSAQLLPGQGTEDAKALRPLFTEKLKAGEC